MDFFRPKKNMNKHSLLAVVLLVSGSSLVAAQNIPLVAPTTSSANPFVHSNEPPRWLAADASVPAIAPLPPAATMSFDVALQVYEHKLEEQARELGSYSATTVIRAEIPSMSQSGEYQLRREYSAPHALEFKVIRAVGDAFVRTNVIARLLRVEVAHVEKDNPALTALTSCNYVFSHKSSGSMDGRPVYIYSVKPRVKRVGLFKGQIYLDARTGALVQVEGSTVKAPSLFIKSIRFVQQYVDVGRFTFLAHSHYEIKTRVVGRAVVDIYNQDYEPVALVEPSG